jgi:hypothetical protein
MVVVVLILALSYWVMAQGGSFLQQLDEKWRTHDATQVLNYVETQRSANPDNAQILAARAIVAVSLQEWGRGATNFLAQAIQKTAASTNYTSSQKQIIAKKLSGLTNVFAALANDAGEPPNSSPKWNTNTHAVVFRELGDEFPHLSTLQILNKP